jgi:phosphopantetheinyl transferase (holo-ACP synthase)
MTSIGNDIVDLNLAKTQSNWQRKGFLEKQFSQKEQREILTAENPFLKVWLFWSMKEAAYKCYTQKFKARFFAPQKFECSFTSEAIGRVVFKENVFYTTSFFNAFYVHTIARETKEEVATFSAVGLPNTIASDLKIKLAVAIGVSSEAIEKRKTVIGAPLFYHREELVTPSCSISHHGNYGAFAFTLENISLKK